MKTTKKRYDQMTAAELRDATREYDRELPTGSDELPGHPMTKPERRRWNKTRKKMGRPKIGRGVKRVMISLETQLLKDSTAFAKKHHFNRSQMISAALRKLMAG